MVKVSELNQRLMKALGEHIALAAAIEAGLFGGELLRSKNNNVIIFPKPKKEYDPVINDAIPKNVNKIYS